MIDRTIAPRITLPQYVKLPQVGIRHTKNGIKLLSLYAGTQSVIRLTVVFAAGTRHQSHPFLASAMLNMLSEGSEKYSSARIAEILDFFGIYYDTNIDRDYSMVTISCLNRFLPQTLELLEQMLLHPVFDENELRIYTAKRKQNIKIEREKPSFIAREEFSKALFGEEHPYGAASDEDLYDGLTRDLLMEQYAKYYVASNCFAVTSGMVSEVELEMIEELLAKIPIGASIEDEAIGEPVSIREKYIPRKNALQTSIRIGRVLFPKNHPDYNGMQIVAMILGGYFGSRLVQNIREEKGYTYGIYAAMVTLKQAGYFAVATDVAAEHSEDAVREIFYEMDRLGSELVCDEELEVVRNTIVGELMRLADGPFGVADITIESEQCGKTNDSVNEFLEEVREITPLRIRELAAKYLSSESMTRVVVG